MEKINIAELLKDCPSGMELDCSMWDNVTFERVADEGIWIKHIDSKSGEHSLYLYNDGSFPIHNLGSLRTKCIIFPKGKTTWEGFQRPYINGDVIVDKYGAIAIYKQVYNSREESLVDFHCGLSSTYKRFCIKDIGSLQNCGEISSIRLATEEEKRQLFDAIKANGYKWNPETKTLEKLIEPKFKVGNKIKKKDSNEDFVLITDIADNYYIVETKYGMEVTISINIQNNYELVPNKFDINTLKPFDKVLVRDNNKQIWTIDYFSFIDDDKRTCSFICIGHYADQCIPYEGNEHLLGTTNDCDEYYKTWE